MIKWETPFWEKQLEPGVFAAHLDTTLALHRPQCPYKVTEALRTADPYTARHLPGIATRWLSMKRLNIIRPTGINLWATGIAVSFTRLCESILKNGASCEFCCVSRGGQ